MKIVKVKRPLSLEFQSDSNNIVRAELPEGGHYVLSDGVVTQTLKLYGSSCLQIERDFKDLPNRFSNHDLTNKSLISIREGGAGDLLFKTPVFRYLKTKYPSCKIALSSSPTYHSLFTNNPFIDAIYPHFISLGEFSNYDYFATFEGLIEGSKDAEIFNAYDLFIRQFGIPIDEIKDKTPVFVLNPQIQSYWKCVLGDALDHPKKIAFQWRASSPVRTIPPYLSAEIIKRLTALGFKIFLLDSTNRKHDVERFIREFGLDVVDTSIYSDNFERMSSIISLCDLFVGPDSSGSHIAAALGIPLVGLFGPFRSHLRLKYYKNAVGIDVEAQKCGNGCFIHSYELCDFAYSTGDKFAPCWRLLDVNVVVNEINGLWEKVNARKMHTL